jgi:prolyl-tRNA editing enzyme YbaK/EbsC (Cys-tRNA(Pro) deacylase)
MHPNCAAVNEILQAAGMTGRVRMLDEAVTTARAAAKRLGCQVGAIANSLVFETALAGSVGMSELDKTAGGAPLLIMASGAHRVDMTKVGELLGCQLRRA